MNPPETAVINLFNMFAEKKLSAPDEDQRLQIMLSLLLMANKVEMVDTIKQNYSSEKVEEMLNTPLTPWAINVLNMMGIKRPSSPNGVDQVT